MDKFYILGIRSNPQLGCYLSKAFNAKPKVNTASITAKFTEYGSSTSLRFALTPNADGVHWCMSQQNCVYGGYSYEGYSSKEKAIAALEKWVNASGSSKQRAIDAIKLFA